ncbi:hypothetical protein FQR65_LT20297 [Abscondita terminalis]|nr:hypothetical protein FQR65_LT20297 [Abscondita terminalis]
MTSAWSTTSPTAWWSCTWGASWSRRRPGRCTSGPPTPTPRPCWPACPGCRRASGVSSRCRAKSLRRWRRPRAATFIRAAPRPPSAAASRRRPCRSGSRPTGAHAILHSAPLGRSKASPWTPLTGLRRALADPRIKNAPMYFASHPMAQKSRSIGRSSKKIPAATEVQRKKGKPGHSGSRFLPFAKGHLFRHQGGLSLLCEPVRNHPSGMAASGQSLCRWHAVRGAAGAGSRHPAGPGQPHHLRTGEKGAGGRPGQPPRRAQRGPVPDARGQGPVPQIAGGGHALPRPPDGKPERHRASRVAAGARKTGRCGAATVARRAGARLKPVHLRRVPDAQNAWRRPMASALWSGLLHAEKAA